MGGWSTRRHEQLGHPLKYYRVVRKFMAKQQGINEHDLEVLIELDDEYFDEKRFRQATLTTSWKGDRLKNLMEEGWVDLYRPYIPGMRKAAIYKPSGKAHRLVNRIYKILNGVEDLPSGDRRNPLERNPDNLKYSEKLLRNAVRLLNKDRQKDKYE